MTLINQNSSVTHNGNGVTTLWPYTFIIPDADSARVGLFDIASSALTELSDTDYSITGLGVDAGGEVTYPLIGSPIASTKRLVIWREVEYTQDTELTNQTPFYPTVLEDQLDRIVMQIQQLAADSDRSIKVTLGSTLTPDEFIEDLQAAEAAAEASAAAASASAAAAAASAAAIDTGVVDNLLLRSDGSGGISTSAAVLDDSGNLSGINDLDISHATAPTLEFKVGAVQRGYLQYSEAGGAFLIDSDGHIDIRPGNTPAVRFNSTGVVDLTSGRLAFPAAQVPSADPNTLDDYEEQNTTPVPTSTGGAFTAVSSLIRTTKIGRLVCVSGTVTITTAGTATGSVFVAVPFTAGAAAGGGGRETAVTGKGLTVSIGNGAAVLTIGYADATTAIANGLVLAFSINYTV